MDNEVNNSIFGKDKKIFTGIIFMIILGALILSFFSFKIYNMDFDGVEERILNGIYVYSDYTVDFKGEGVTLNNLTKFIRLILESMDEVNDMEYTKAQITNVKIVFYTILTAVAIPILSAVGIVTSIVHKKIFDITLLFLTFFVIVQGLFYTVTKWVYNSDTESQLLQTMDYGLGYYVLILFPFILIFILRFIIKDRKQAAAYAFLIPIIGYFLGAILSKRYILLMWYGGIFIVAIIVLGLGYIMPYLGVCFCLIPFIYALSFTLMSDKRFEKKY